MLKSTAKKFAKGRYVKVPACCLGIAITLNTASIPAAYLLNRSVVHKSRTVVFTSGYDDYFDSSSWIAKACDFFMYTPVTLRQTFKGRKVDWFSNASKETVLEKLADKSYDSVVFIGHGGRRYYCTSTGYLFASQIESKGIKKKNGELIQHTCGGGSGASLREIIMKDPSKGYGFDGNIDHFRNYVRAWVELLREISNKASFR